MSGKYTPETALAIKRDIHKSQQTLGFLIQEIESRRLEKEEVETELEVVKGLLEQKRKSYGTLFVKLFTVFDKRMSKIEDLKEYEGALSTQIKKLEQARDLAAAQYEARKQASVELPEGTQYLESVIGLLTKKLDKILSDIDVKEEHLEAIKVDIKHYEEAKIQAESEKIETEQKVHSLRLKMERIDDEREATLRELAREKNKLSEIKKRDRDSAALNRRLTAEYKEVYDTLPRRGKK